MNSYIYKSLIKDGLYLYLNKKDNFSDVPQALLNSFGRLQYVMELKLDTNRKLAREDVNKVMLRLQEKGFFVQMPPTKVPESLLIKNSKLH